MKPYFLGIARQVHSAPQNYARSVLMLTRGRWVRDQFLNCDRMHRRPDLISWWMMRYSVERSCAATGR